MMIALATVTATLAVLAGVLLAALDRPPADTGPHTEQHTRRMSLALVIATSVTAMAGVTYVFIA